MSELPVIEKLQGIIPWGAAMRGFWFKGAQLAAALAGAAMMLGTPAARAGTTVYTYDAFGNLISTEDPSGNVTTATYDVRGRRIMAYFPDMGAVTTTYDVFNEPTQEVDAKGQTVTVAYDLLGRRTQLNEPDLTSTWVYDSATHGVGKLASATSSNGYSRALTYDSYSRQSGVSLVIGGVSTSFATAYNSTTSMVASVTYPSGFQASYAYTATGYVQSITDPSSNTVLWQSSTQDAELHVTQYKTANGVVTNQAFDPNTGYFQTIQAGVTSGTAVANFTYAFDTVDNLIQRQDLNESLTETFQFDPLNRLTQYAIAGGATKTVSYDALGDITAKSGVGTYSYPAAGQAHPHAVSAINGTVNGVANPSFTYDLNGNMTAGAGRTVSYTSYDMPILIQEGTASVAFTYNGDHERITHVGFDGTLQYLNDATVGVSTERLQNGSTVTFTDYLFDGTKRVGMRVSTTGSSPVFSYFIQDHLGSVALITGPGGAVIARQSYDAWGKRRYPTGTDDTTDGIRSPTRRGFTDHEMLDEVGLIDMNARVYDPLLGRFMTPDGMIPDPYDLQTYNRYTYVYNRPLSLTDPTGHFGAGAASGVWSGGEDLGGMAANTEDEVWDQTKSTSSANSASQGANSDAVSVAGATGPSTQAVNAAVNSNAFTIATNSGGTSNFTAPAKSADVEEQTGYVDAMGNYWPGTGPLKGSDYNPLSHPLITGGMMAAPAVPIAAAACVGGGCEAAAAAAGTASLRTAGRACTPSAVC